MNPRKTAALLALIVAMIATVYLGYQLYENQILLRHENQLLNCLELRTKNGPDFPCDVDNPAMEYGISGGIAVVAYIASLALFGAGKAKG